MNDRINALRKMLFDDSILYISSAANVFYYSGFICEDAELLISNDRKILITDFRYVSAAKLAAPDYELYTGTLEKLFEQFSETRVCFEDKSVTYFELSKLKKSAGEKVFVAMGDRISKPRYIKSDEEINAIRQSEKIGDEAFSYILDYIKPGVCENEIAARLEFYMKMKGASSTSFQTICASGKRSAMPHGMASEKIIENGDLLTMDFGCIYNGYCSDMTRTVGVGKLDDKSKEIYKIVLDAQNAAISEIKCGMKCSNADNIARKIISDAGYSQNFGHSLGHSVGIEIHENPNLSPKSEDILEVGNVVTVEPGIYIENFGGVRIEDVIAIKSNEIVNLTSSPKELIIL